MSDPLGFLLEHEVLTFNFYVRQASLKFTPLFLPTPTCRLSGANIVFTVCSVAKREKLSYGLLVPGITGYRDRYCSTGYVYYR